MILKKNCRPFFSISSLMFLLVRRMIIHLLKERSIQKVLKGLFWRKLVFLVLTELLNFIEFRVE